jgi:hypothetical protein
MGTAKTYCGRCGKRSFNYRSKALRHLKHIAATHDYDKNPRTLNVYLCTRGVWHVGHSHSATPDGRQAWERFGNGDHHVE